MAKPKISFHDFTSCEGCQLQVLNCEDELLGILGAVEIVQFREAIDDRRDDYDIAFIEGAFSREIDRPRLEKIRRNAKIVVALGACATTGGLNVLKNYRGISESMKKVYGDKAGWYATNAALFSQAGVPAVVFGPGFVEQAHTADEWIPLDQLRQATEILYRFCLASAT